MNRLLPTPHGSLLTAIAFAIALAGCATTVERDYVQDRNHPLIRVTREGLKFQERPVTPEEVIDCLEALDFPKTDTLYVQVDPDYTNQRALYVFQHNYLIRAGYSRAIMIHPTRAESGTADKVSNKPGKRSVEFTGRTIR